VVKSVETYNTAGLLTTVDWYAEAGYRDERDVFDSAGRADSFQTFDAAGRVDAYGILNDFEQVTQIKYFTDSNVLEEVDNYHYNAGGHVDLITTYDGYNHVLGQFYYNDAGVQTADTWFYADGSVVPEIYEPNSTYDPDPTPYQPDDLDYYY
jgi:hypothetical protein